MPDGALFLSQQPHHLGDAKAGCACALHQVAAPWEQPFEAGHIKSMELVVLASLNWRVNALTPASFLDPFLGALLAAGVVPVRAGLQRLRCWTLALVTRTLPGQLGPGMPCHTAGVSSIPWPCPARPLYSLAADGAKIPLAPLLSLSASSTCPHAGSYVCWQPSARMHGAVMLRCHATASLCQDGARMGLRR